jgi:transposase
VYLAHAGYVSKLKQSPDKSDFTDARVLSDLARVDYLPRVWHAPRWIRDLRMLVRHRQSLAQQRRAIKLRIRAVLREQRVIGGEGRPWTLKWLLWLERGVGLSEQGRWTVLQLLEDLRYVQSKIHSTEARLKRQVASDPMVMRLMEKPGIGLIIASTLRAEIGRFDRFGSGKQVSNFCGLSPRNVSTGRKQADAGLLDQANKQLRAVILQGAHQIKRREPRWAALADQMKRRGKHGSVIVAAIANRWIRSLFHEMRSMGLAQPPAVGTSN